jgi:hypothetical protein
MRYNPADTLTIKSYLSEFAKEADDTDIAQVCYHVLSKHVEDLETKGSFPDHELSAESKEQLKALQAIVAELSKLSKLV